MNHTTLKTVTKRIYFTKIKTGNKRKVKNIIANEIKDPIAKVLQCETCSAVFKVGLHGCTVNTVMCTQYTVVMKRQKQIRGQVISNASPISLK